MTVAALQEIQVSADADRSRGLEPEPIELVASVAVRDTLGALGRTTRPSSALGTTRRKEARRASTSTRARSS
ncbi:hypothetical protein [Gaiella sp.]|uniref:hypothetical protein n=1 Tax=Gaiella sp. TaxID=2663207 RepID=UPI002C940B46|nr:hypothetical protein [Gaiella sp.]HWO81262.1 hypothetical protein [Gaiella sp.]